MKQWWMCLLVSGCSLFAPRTNWEKQRAEEEAKQVRTNAEEACRVGSEVLERCMEVRGFESAEAPAFTRSEAHAAMILRCYSDLQETGTFSGLAQIDEAVREGDVQLSKDPGATDCRARIEATDPDGWQTYLWHEEATKLGMMLASEFKQKCGWKARLDRSSWETGSAVKKLQVLLVDVPRKTRERVRKAEQVFTRSDSPAYEVRCNGQLALGKDGSKLVEPAFVRNQMETRSEAIERCKTYVCPELRCGHTDMSVGCMGRCTAECDTNPGIASRLVPD